MKQEDKVNAGWNTVYIKIFGFHRWESVKCFIWDLGRLDLHHINLWRKSSFTCKFLYVTYFGFFLRSVLLVTVIYACLLEIGLSPM